MDEIIFTARIKDGKLYIVNRAQFDEQVILFGDKELEIIVRKKRRIRSPNMNRYYWAEVVKKVQQGLKETGDRLTLSETDEWIKEVFETITKEQAHEFLKDRFIDKIEVDEDTGEIAKKKITTTNMTTSEFQDYIATIVQFAAENLNIQILMPGEQSQMDY